MEQSNRYEVSFDPAKLASLEAKEEAHEERRKRILDAESRNGMDTAYLEEEMRSKQLEETLEREQQLLEDEKQLKLAKYVEAQEREALRAKKQRELEDLQYSEANVSKEQSREWYLNDPAALAKDRTARIDRLDEHGNVIVDKSCGVSSGQIFDGEDLCAKQRLQREEEQFLTDEERLMDQKRQEVAALNAQRLKEDQEQLKINAYIAANEKLEEQKRRERERDIARFNEETAALEKDQELQEKKADDQEARKAGEYFEATRMMQEASRPGITDEFRGFSKAEIGEINQQLEQQIADTVAQRRLLAEQSMNSDEQELRVNKARQILEVQQAQADARRRREIAEENERLSYEQKEAKRLREKELGRNEINDDFFAYFGKSER